MSRDRQYLLHILDAIQQILTYTSDGQGAFLADRKSQDATIRNLEIIGEAVKRLSPAVLGAHPQIPWKQIAGMRDKMIHDYFGVDHRLVWDVVERHLPALLKVVNERLAVLPDA